MDRNDSVVDPCNYIPLVTRPDDLRQDADFASLCSFIQNFGADLGIFLTFEQLFKFLSLQEGVDWKKWETLHVKLLNRIKYRASTDRWETVLARFLQNHGLDTDELHQTADRLRCTPGASFKTEPHLPRSVYYSLDAHVRTKVLMTLLDVQFERNSSFKEKVNMRSSEDLRFRPIGHDVWGRAYWLLKDSEIDILLYRENWETNAIQLICENPEQIRQLYVALKDVCIDGSTLSSILTNSKHPTALQNGIVCDRCSAAEASTDEESPRTPPPSPVEGTEKPVSLLSSDQATSKLDDEGPEKPTSPLLKPSDEMISKLDDDDPKHTDVKESLKTEQQQQQLDPETSELPVPSDFEHKLEDVQPVVVDQQVEETKHSKQQSKKRNFACTEYTTEVRRSGRQRKPVEFLTMEPLQPKRSRAVKAAPKQPLVQPNTTDEPKASKRKQAEGSAKGKEKRSKDEAKKLKRKKKKKKRKRTRKNHSNPWDKASSSSDTDDEDDTFERALLEPDSDGSETDLDVKAKKPELDWLDHIESDVDLDDIPSSESEVDSLTHGRNLARQRRLQKSRNSGAVPAAATDAMTDPSEQCQICDGSHSPELILLCDRCDLGHHTMCLSPPLHFIPEGDWYCPRCQHAALLTVLSEFAETLTAEKKKLVVWKRMQDRLNYVNISMTNILADDDEVSESNEHRRNRRPVVYEESSVSGSGTEESFQLSSDDNSDNSVRRVKRSARSGRLPRHVNGGRHSRNLDSESEMQNDYASSISGVSRPTRQKSTSYNLNDAFKQLDEVLEMDEKYKEEKQARKSKKPHQENDHANLENVPDWKVDEDSQTAFRQTRRRPTKYFSSSSTQDGSESEDSVIRTRRRSRKADEDFKPSPPSDTEDDSSESDGSTDQDTPESESSAGSWLCVARRSAKRNSRFRNKRSSRRSGPTRRRGRPVPRFEENSGDSNYARPQRRTRTVVSYRESDDEESGVSIPRRSKTYRLRSPSGGNSTKSDDFTSERPARPPHDLSSDSEVDNAASRRKVVSDDDSSDNQPSSLIKYGSAQNQDVEPTEVNPVATLGTPDGISCSSPHFLSTHTPSAQRFSPPHPTDLEDSTSATTPHSPHFSAPTDAVNLDCPDSVVSARSPDIFE